jgi:hypothetical protein
MGLLSKIFGQSELEEEFNRCSGLKWVLIIQNIRKVQQETGTNSIITSYTPCTLYFNFKTNELSIEGEIARKLFLGDEQFIIKKSNILDGEPEFYLASNNAPEAITLNCRVSGKHIILERTLVNWRCKLVNENNWIISTTNKYNIV